MRTIRVTCGSPGTDSIAPSCQEPCPGRQVGPSQSRSHSRLSSALFLPAVFIYIPLARASASDVYQDGFFLSLHHLKAVHYLTQRDDTPHRSATTGWKARGGCLGEAATPTVVTAGVSPSRRAGGSPDARPGARESRAPRISTLQNCGAPTSVAGRSRTAREERGVGPSCAAVTLEPGVQRKTYSDWGLPIDAVGVKPNLLRRLRPLVSSPLFTPLASDSSARLFSL